MAIAIGSRVALTILGADLSLGQICAQPPVFGVSETAGAGPYVIDWENGNQATVPLGVLDELFAADPTTLNFVGKVVAVPDESSAYNALVVAAYNRGAAQECLLVKTLTGGVYRELDPANAVVVPGY